MGGSSWDDWQEDEWSFPSKRSASGRRRPDEPDKDGIYPIGMGAVLKARSPYAYKEFYQHRAGGKHNAAVYSDRLMQWDYDKFNRCCVHVWDNEGQYFSSREPKEIERFLQLYNDSPELKLVDIIEGCNVGNGYPYWVFRYNDPKLDVDPDKK